MNDAKDNAKNKRRPESKPATDMVGIELGSGNPAGTPAARLRRDSAGALELTAAALLPLDSTLPALDAEASKNGGWVLPRAFQAPDAAFAITSDDAFLRQASGIDEAMSDKEEVRFRTLSHGGDAESFPFVAALPDAVAAWAARLLPEGRRPTAVSIQVSDLAWLNAFAVSSTFSKTTGTALLLVAGASSTALAIFHDFEPILYRKHSIGAQDVLDAVCRKMNLDQGTARDILNDTLIDPTSVIEPILAPLFRQAEMSADYAVRMKGCFVEHFFLCGLKTGVRYWADVFKQRTGATIVPCNPALEMARAPGAVLPEDFENLAGVFIPAIGAAAAAMEGA
ncbi:MAG: hypothetical protein ACOX9C_08150 [Kiritimatiellia bacterium]|jgi:hypothetical protein